MTKKKRCSTWNIAFRGAIKIPNGRTKKINVPRGTLIFFCHSVSIVLFVIRFAEKVPLGIYIFVIPLGIFIAVFVIP